jgi:hypothetical protein
MKKSFSILLLCLVSFLSTAKAASLRCQSTEMQDVNQNKWWRMSQELQFVKNNSVHFDLEYQGYGPLSARSIVLKRLSIKGYPTLQNIALAETQGYKSSGVVATFPRPIASLPEAHGAPPLTDVRLIFETNKFNGALKISFSISSQDADGSYGNVWFMDCTDGSAHFDPNL